MFLFGLIFGASGIIIGLIGVIGGTAPNPFKPFMNQRNVPALAGTKARIVGAFYLLGGIALFWMGMGDLLSSF